MSQRGGRLLSFFAVAVLLLMLFAITRPVATAQTSGGVVINEIMQNPSAVSDGSGEWFELVNVTTNPIDIDGWTIRDDDFDSHVIANGGPLVIPAGGYLVLGVNADTTTNGGVTVDYVYSGVFLGNSSDEVVLEDATGTEIDRVNYDDGVTFPDPNGASMSLVDPADDNNVGANWCEASTAYGAGDLGTPGAANDCPTGPPPPPPPPATSDVVINEIMQNPAAVSDSSGEWFELTNVGANPIDIEGWTIRDDDFDSHVIANGGPLVIPSGGYLVLGNNADMATNGGVTVDYVYSGFFLSNGADEVVLVDTSANEIDRVNYDGGATFPDPNGASMALVDPADDNNVGANWCVASTAYGAGDLGTPGAANDCPTGPPPPVVVDIHDIQGAAHTSPYNLTTVNDVDGIVTALENNGFYLQEADANVDGDPATSEAIFVFTGGAPAVAVGDAITVTSAFVSEFGFSGDLTTTQLSQADIVIESSGNPLPAPTVIGLGGRVPPTEVIDDDGLTSFDADTDGIDFYESLEAMRVQVNEGYVVGPTNRFGEIWILSDDGAYAGPFTSRGGIQITPTDFNPERIQIEDDIYPGSWPQLDVGAELTDPVIGVVSYSFSNFEILVTEIFGVDTSGEVTREVTSLVGAGPDLTVGSFNVENLGGDADPSEFASRADQIVNNLLSPDILVLEEIQDNDGSTSAGDPAADQTYAKLIQAIVDAGGPTYEFSQIDPVDGQDGGIPGGNIRVGFLYNPARVSLASAPSGDATTANTVSCAAGDPMLDLNPGRIDPSDPSYTGSRKSLAGEFVFRGQTVFVIGVHFSSKRGDDPLFGATQPPVLNSEPTRIGQAQAVNDFVDQILACDPNAYIVVAGDMNDFPWSAPLQTLTGGVLVNLMDTLPYNEQYSYVFQGNSQVLDQIVVSQALLDLNAVYDVVHTNAEFADQVSDHDPSVARFTFPNAAPSCEAAAPSIASIWPPNHKFVPVDITGVTDPEGDAVTITIDSIFQDEEVDSTGDGAFAPDGRGVGTSTAEVRAERSARGNGRVYHISYTATDEFGAACSGVVQVSVPRSQGGTAIDDGPLYDSTMMSLVSVGQDRSAQVGSALTFEGRLAAGVAAPMLEWSFGDGSSASGTLAPTHRFDAAGLYEVTLVASDATGEVGRDTLMVAVGEPTAVTLGSLDSAAGGGNALAIAALALVASVALAATMRRRTRQPR